MNPTQKESNRIFSFQQIWKAKIANLTEIDNRMYIRRLRIEPENQRRSRTMEVEKAAIVVARVFRGGCGGLSKGEKWKEKKR